MNTKVRIHTTWLLLGLVTLVISGASLGQTSAHAPAAHPTPGDQRPWVWVSIFPGGEQIFGLYEDVNRSDTLYACTAHGLFRTTNGGHTWMPVYVVDAGFISLAQSKSSPNVMYLGTAAGYQGRVLKSIDSGSSWQVIGANEIQRPVHGVYVDPKNPDVAYALSDSTQGLFICERCVLYKTMNGGRSWGDVSPDAGGEGMRPSLGLVAVDPFKSLHLLVGDPGHGSNLGETFDGGVSWQFNPGAVASVRVNGYSSKMVEANVWRSYFFHPTDARLRAALVQVPGSIPPNFVVSQDGGASWNDVSLSEENANQFNNRAETSAFAWSAANPTAIYVGTARALYGSSDYGQRWHKLLSSPVSVVSQASGDIFAATSEGLLKSRDAGHHWHLASLGLPTMASNRGLGGAQNENIFDAFQEGWTTGLSLLQSADGEDLYVTGRGGFWTGSLDGMSWRWHDLGAQSSSSEFNTANVRQLCVAKDKTKYAITVVQGAFATGGAEILKIATDQKVSKLKIAKSPNFIAISPSDSQVLYVTASEGVGSGLSPKLGTTLMKSDDGGFSWQSLDLARGLRQKVAGDQIAAISIVAVAPSTPKAAYVLTRLRGGGFDQGDSALEVTADGGDSWRDVFPFQISAMRGSQQVNQLGEPTAVVVDPSDWHTVYLAFANGLFQSQDAGDSWARLALPAKNISDVAVSQLSSKLLYVAAQEGIWLSKDSGATWALTRSLYQDPMTRIRTVGKLAFAQGYSGIYRFSDEDFSAFNDTWQQLEQDPSSNPISAPEEESACAHCNETGISTQPAGTPAMPSPTQAAPTPQATEMSFAVRHRHNSVFNLGTPNAMYFCYGTLSISQDGTVRYDCAQTNDPSGRCDHVVFRKGSLKQVKIGLDGALHLGSKAQGNFDFYGDRNGIKQAEEAISPLVQQ
jgi:photosystem II stability/assembly factor-like uncharacterized protein